MSGEDLYEIYRRSLQTDWVEVDDWDDLDDEEQRAWNAVAAAFPPPCACQEDF